MHNITQECVQWTALSHSWFLCDYCIFFPPVRMVLTVGFSYITFIMLSIYPLVLHSLRFLSWKYIEFGQRLLLHLLKWSLDILPYIHLFLNLWDKAHLIMVDNIFVYVCICFMCIKEFSPSLFVLLDQNVALSSTVPASWCQHAHITCQP